MCRPFPHFTCLCLSFAIASQARKKEDTHNPKLNHATELVSKSNHQPRLMGPQINKHLTSVDFKDTFNPMFMAIAKDTTNHEYSMNRRESNALGTLSAFSMKPMSNRKEIGMVTKRMATAPSIAIKTFFIKSRI